MAAKTLDAFDYLAQPVKHPAKVAVVLYGDEPFLKRLVVAELRKQVLSGTDADFSVNVFAGPDVTMVDVSDALATRGLFGGGRPVVIVEEADEFVSSCRSALEDYVAKPKGDSLLVLDVKLWPSTTRLYKAVAAAGLPIECKFPAPARLIKWLSGWARERHQASLEPAAAEMLAETVEPDLGLFDQELAKLAALAGGGTITAKLVGEAVGGWRARTAWDMLDAALAGDAPMALAQLERLLWAGEVPIALLGQIAASLRRLAAATRLVEQGGSNKRSMSLGRALEESGVKPYFIQKTEEQLRRLGRARGAQLYGWLLEADLALKGTSSSPARSRLVLETLIVRLAAPQTSAPAAAKPVAAVRAR